MRQFMKYFFSNNFLIKISAFCLCIALAVSCVSSRQINYMQDIAAQLPPDTAQNPDYRLQLRDLLYIRVFSSDETAAKLFNTTQTNQGGTLYSYQIFEDGTIDLPFVGAVFVQGKTLREAKTIIETELSKILSSVSVNLSIQNKTFSIIGESGCGRFAMPRERINIFQALALSGGLSTFSDRKHLKIIRQMDNGETKIFNVDIRSKDIVNSEFYYILPNDVIYVPYMTEKTFGITHFTGILSTTLSTISLVATIVNLGVLIAK